MADSPTVARFVRLSTMQVQLNGQVSAALALEMISHCRSLEAAGKAVVGTNRRLTSQIACVREQIEQIVCTAGEDAGVVLLSNEGPTSPEIIDGKNVHVYDHAFFSPLGDALIALYESAGGEVKP